MQTDGGDGHAPQAEGIEMHVGNLLQRPSDRAQIRWW